MRRENNNANKNGVFRSAWLAKSVKHVTLDFGVLGSSPMLWVEVTKKIKKKRKILKKNKKKPTTKKQSFQSPYHGEGHSVYLMLVFGFVLSERAVPVEMNRK